MRIISCVTGDATLISSPVAPAFIILRVYVAAASGSVIILILSLSPTNPALVTAWKVKSFALSDHTAGTVRTTSSCKVSNNALPYELRR